MSTSLAQTASQWLSKPGSWKKLAAAISSRTSPASILRTEDAGPPLYKYVIT
jgi:hypothetical protein